MTESDEEPTEEEDVELAVNNQGRRYPLRERRAPADFRMKNVYY